MMSVLAIPEALVYTVEPERSARVSVPAAPAHYYISKGSSKVAVKNCVYNRIYGGRNIAKPEENSHQFV